MTILPVSSISLNGKSRISFIGDKEVYPKDQQYTPPVDGDMEVSPRESKGRGARYASVPVAVWMVLNPALSAQAAEMSTPEPKQITMEMPYSPVESDSEVMYAYPAAPAAAKQEVPDKHLPPNQRLQYDYDFESQFYLSKNQKPVLVQKFSSGTHNYAIVYCTDKKWAPNSIRGVYLFEKGEPLIELKRITALVDHNIGPNDEFCGALVVQDVYNDAKELKGSMKYEIKLPDDIAENLVKLLTNDLEWKNESAMDYIEVNSNKLIPPQTIATY